jgi:phenylalanyl-tRNA synthetase alpha chain
VTPRLSALLECLDSLPDKSRNAFAGANTESELNRVKADFVGKNGLLKQVMQQLRGLDPADRPVLGKAVNDARAVVESLLEKRRAALRQSKLESDLTQTRVDLTLPARVRPRGSIHPLRRVHREMVDIFRTMGYSVAVGPEVETDFYNFEALNFPPDHPARDMQDTLLLKNGHLLRTHTSPVQIRTMLAYQPPIRVIAPGTVYRCDADVSHSPMFSQVEGLLVDRNVSMANLKGTLTSFAQRLFGQDVPIRLRPSYFPFTEPSCEVDIGCVFCVEGKSCRVCGDTTWLEILGAGMVDPNVFESVGYDPEEWSGFAFGMGIERIAMLKYGVNDIRLFFENDARFLRQLS